jgi:hypothetical protein
MNGPNLQLLDSVPAGLLAEPDCSLVGLAYGFLIGFVTGWLFAFMRNTACFLMAGLHAPRRRAEGAPKRARIL